MSSLSSFKSIQPQSTNISNGAKIVATEMVDFTGGTLNKYAPPNQYILLSIEFNNTTTDNTIIRFGGRNVSVYKPSELGYANELRNNMIKGGLGEDLQIVKNSGTTLKCLIFTMEF